MLRVKILILPAWALSSVLCTTSTLPGGKRTCVQLNCGLLHLRPYATGMPGTLRAFVLQPVFYFETESTCLGTSSPRIQVFLAQGGSEVKWSIMRWRNPGDRFWCCFRFCHFHWLSHLWSGDCLYPSFLLMKQATRTLCSAEHLIESPDQQ